MLGIVRLRKYESSTKQTILESEYVQCVRKVLEQTQEILVSIGYKELQWTDWHFTCSWF